MGRKSVSGMTTMVSVSDEATQQEETLTVSLRGKKLLTGSGICMRREITLIILSPIMLSSRNRKKWQIFWHFISEIQIEIRKNTGLIRIGRIPFGTLGQIQKEKKKSISSLNGYKRIWMKIRVIIIVGKFSTIQYILSVFVTFREISPGWINNLK